MVTICVWLLFAPISVACRVYHGASVYRLCSNDSTTRKEDLRFTKAQQFIDQVATKGRRHQEGIYDLPRCRNLSTTWQNNASYHVTPIQRSEVYEQVRHYRCITKGNRQTDSKRGLVIYPVAPIERYEVYEQVRHYRYNTEVTLVEHFLYVGAETTIKHTHREAIRICPAAATYRSGGHKRTTTKRGFTIYRGAANYRPFAIQ